MGEMKFERVYDPNSADLHISWIKDYGPHVLGESIFKSIIKVGLGTSSCYGQWQPFDAETVTKITWHEIGHSLGYGHSNNPNNIMYYQIERRFEKDYEASISLDEGYAHSILFCNAGTYSYNVISNDESHGFLIYVLDAGTTAQMFLDGSGKYYPSCSGDEKYVSFSNSCTVPSGATLLVYNEDELLKFSSISVKVIITDLNERKWPDMRWDESVFEYDEQWLDEVWNLYH